MSIVRSPNKRKRDIEFSICDILFVTPRLKSKKRNHAQFILHFTINEPQYPLTNTIQNPIIILELLAS